MNTWQSHLKNASININGIERECPVDADNTLRFTIIPRSEPNTVEGFIVSSEIIPDQSERDEVEP